MDPPVTDAGDAPSLGDFAGLTPCPYCSGELCGYSLEIDEFVDCAEAFALFDPEGVRRHAGIMGECPGCSAWGQAWSVCLPCLAPCTPTGVESAGCFGMWQPVGEAVWAAVWLARRLDLDVDLLQLVVRGGALIVSGIRSCTG